MCFLNGGGGRGSIQMKPAPPCAVLLLDIVGFTGPTRLQPPSAHLLLTAMDQLCPCCNLLMVKIF